jgi:ELWxxDGT repeat protein
MLAALVSLSRRPLLTLGLALAILAASASPPASATEPGEPFLVRNIETTGEPLTGEWCAWGTPWCFFEIYGATIRGLTPLGERVVFVANDRIHGFEPWVSDGTEEGTRLLADTCPGDCGDRAPLFLGELEGRLFFFSSPQPFESDYWDVKPPSDLWVTDGTPEGTRALVELCPDLCGVRSVNWAQELPPGESGGFVAHGSVYFLLNREDDRHTYDLWRTDGTPEGTTGPLQATSRWPVGPFRSAFVYHDGFYLGHSSGLLRFDGTDDEPTVVWSRSHQLAAPLGDRMILRTTGRELRVMDGPDSEPELLRDFGPSCSLSQLTTAGEHVYFLRHCSGSGSELWRTDGTAGGTKFLGIQAVQIVGAIEGDVLIDGDGRIDSHLLIDGLRRVDPDGEAQILTDLPVARDLAVAGSHVFFSADDGIHGSELWVSDGTAEGTRLLADIAPGPESSEPGYSGRDDLGGTDPRFRIFVAAGDHLFFPATHPELGTELWALELPFEEPACLPDDEVACLLDGRFEVTVDWYTAQATGRARVMTFDGQRAESDQSVFLWFFGPENFEMGVKMVDACVPPFESFWVFQSGLTNQGYDVTIRDTVTDQVRIYNNPLGSFPTTTADTAAFPCVEAGPSGAGAVSRAGGGLGWPGGEWGFPARPAPGDEAAAAGRGTTASRSAGCTPGSERACLLGGRFEVEVEWDTDEGTGMGQVMTFSGARAETDQSAFWWFFEPENFEMGVKMVDACTPPFERFWVFQSGLTSQGYTVTVRDTATGAEREYTNPRGTLPTTTGDTSAFPCP